ncbi:MAG: hypothetical protein H6Q38_2496 [Chloroflexi bacterium]|nr:hypothetical protein [Chloroflexota bacterium]
MNRADGSQFLIAFFFVLRCLVPLAVMLGISYLLRRLKLISEPQPPPPGWENGDDNDSQNPGTGGLAHG